jgi:hypothetical protein
VSEVVYRGNVDGSESSALEHGTHVLPLNEPVDVPDEVVEHLTSGENEGLFKIDKAGSTDKLTGDALKQRAQDLDIQGRGEMSADELRQAVAEAEGAGS